MSDENAKDATITIMLRANSGYRSDTSAKISPRQWQAINLILEEAVAADAVIGLRVDAAMKKDRA